MNTIEQWQKDLLIEYLEYHGSTNINPVKIIWYTTPNGTKLEYFLVRHTDGNGDKLSGIYDIRKDAHLNNYVSEEEFCAREDEKEMVFCFVNDTDELWSAR